MVRTIINYEKKVGRQLEKIQQLQGGNKRILLDFYDFLRTNEYSSARIDRYLSLLRLYAEHLGHKRFMEADKKDVEKFFLQLMEAGKKPWTIATYKHMLKRFYKWLNNDQDYPECVAWLKVRDPKLKVSPDEILTQEDVLRLIQHARLARDKAIIAVLFDAGLRVSELAGMRVKDVKDEGDFFRISVTGKTGPRNGILLVFSAPYLREWLNQHPYRDDPNAFLWANLQRPGETLEYQYFRMLLKRAAERAGVRKPVNPHAFRHASATFWANYLSHYQMCQRFGWELHSSMPSVYISLAGKDMDRAVLAAYGLEKKGEGGFPEAGRRCPACGLLNPATSLYCSRCHALLDPQAAVAKASEYERMQEELERLGSIVSRLSEKLGVNLSDRF